MPEENTAEMILTVGRETSAYSSSAEPKGQVVGRTVDETMIAGRAIFAFEIFVTRKANE